MIETRELYERAVKKWGYHTQMMVAIEECAELIVALNKFFRDGHQQHRVLEGIADVEIMMEQLRLMFDENEINGYRKDKLARLKRRLEVVAE